MGTQDILIELNALIKDAEADEWFSEQNEAYVEGYLNAMYEAVRVIEDMEYKG